MPEIKSPFMTADEAAAWLRTTAAALAQKRQRGCGPPYCQPDGPNTKVLYRLSDLEEWSSRPRGDIEAESVEAIAVGASTTPVDTEMNTETATEADEPNAR